MSSDTGPVAVTPTPNTGDVPEDVRKLAEQFAPDVPDYAVTAAEMRTAIEQAILADRASRPASGGVRVKALEAEVAYLRRDRIMEAKAHLDAERRIKHPSHCKVWTNEPCTCGLSASIADAEAHLRGISPSADTNLLIPEHGWTCFHCGETFHTEAGARRHFGHGPEQVAECLSALDPIPAVEAEPSSARRSGNAVGEPVAQAAPVDGRLEADLRELLGTLNEWFAQRADGKPTTNSEAVMWREVHGRLNILDSFDLTPKAPATPDKTASAQPFDDAYLGDGNSVHVPTSAQPPALVPTPPPGEVEKLREAGTVRVCPARDAICPHGVDCPYGIEPHWYDCNMDASRAALKENPNAR